MKYWALILAFLFLGSSIPSNPAGEKIMDEYWKCKYQELQYQHALLKQQKPLQAIAELTNTEIARYCNDHKLIPHTNIRVLDKVNIYKFDKRLLSALLSYQGPPFIITSQHRRANYRSKHYHGQAIDIRWDDDFINYLGTPQGECWLEETGLDYYIEDVVRSSKIKNLPKSVVDKVFINRSATAPHLHFYV